MLIAAAVCPHPPLLIPEVATGAASELDDLRAACDEAVRRLVGPSEPPDLIVAVGADETTRCYGAEAAGGLHRYGLELTFGAGPPVLPLSLTVGRWLLTRAGVLPMGDTGACAERRMQYADGAQQVRFQGVDERTTPQACLRLGRQLAASAQRVALLAMGDGTACRTEKAPGYLDRRAEPYDAEVARALGHGDAAALARLDPQTSSQLRVAGRAAWQVMAGAAGDGRFTAELLAEEAPYGVGYFVASWRTNAAISDAASGEGRQ